MGGKSCDAAGTILLISIGVVAIQPQGRQVAPKIERNKSRARHGLRGWHSVFSFSFRHFKIVVFAAGGCSECACTGSMWLFSL